MGNIDKSDEWMDDYLVDILVVTVTKYDLPKTSVILSRLIDLLLEEGKKPDEAAEIILKEIEN